MSRGKKWLVAFVAVAAFVGGYGTVANAFPTPYWRGYFFNALDTAGLEVMPPWGGPAGCQGDGWALPGWVDTPAEFINFISCKRWNGNTQNRIGAAFIVSSMINQSNPNPTAAQMNEFAARVNYAASRGWINWGAVINCPLPNTYFQDGPGDVAAYGGCGSGANNAVVFSDGATFTYIIKRFCSNPLGSMPALPDDLNFNMSGSSTVNDNTVTPGQQITFSHSMTNGGPTATNTGIGWTVQSSTSSSGPWTDTATTGATGILSSGQGTGTIGSQNVIVPAAAAPNSQICRRILWTPDTHAGGSEASSPACATVQYSFTLVSDVGVQITSGGSPISGDMAEVGDTVTFTYRIINSGLTVSQPVTCTYRQTTYPGYNTTPPTTVVVPSAPNWTSVTCPPARTIPGTTTGGNNVSVATETITGLTENTSICRSLTITPTSAGGGSYVDQVCAHVSARPFVSVRGGDISAGGGVVTASGTCSTNSGAAIIGWNRGGAPNNYQGAGVQFAAYALSTILGVATSQGNGAGAAAMPTGLSFANTSTTPAAGIFGGGLGSVPCMPDHYGTLPATYSTIGSASTSAALSGGAYFRNGNLTLTAGAIAANNRVSVYVDGNVYISGDVTYNGSGSWTSSTIPMFRLIARGNIYIASGVTQLNGLYVAQSSDGSSGGIIYTCATGMGSPVALTLLGNNCGTQLTVNGNFTARQVYLMRSAGSLNSGTAAETFNYNPALWMAQPANISTGVEWYDSITSLPPVL